MLQEQLKQVFPIRVAITVWYNYESFQEGTITVLLLTTTLVKIIICIKHIINLNDLIFYCDDPYQTQAKITVWDFKHIIFFSQ